MEKDIDNPLKGKTPYGWHFEQNVYSQTTRCIRALKAGGGSGNIPKVIVEEKNNGNLHSGNLQSSPNM